MARVAFELSIPSWETITGLDGSKYTVYDITVSYDCKQWVVRKRYSECLALHNQISKDRHIPQPFPPAPLLPFGQFSTSFIEQRRQELEAYFQAASGRIVGHSAADKFFGVGDKSIPFKSVYTKNLFLPAIWPPASLRRFPETAKINGDVTFVRGLVGTICTLIAKLQAMEDNLFKQKALDQRINLLETGSLERKQVTGELAASLTTMSEIINSGGLNAEFVADAVTINEVGLTALAWAQNVEEQLLSGLESDGGQDVASPTRIMKLQKQVEVSLALLVSAQSEEERKSAVDAILELVTLLKRDIQIAEIRRQPQQVTDLRALLAYLEQAASSHRRNPGSLVSDQDVAILEERMFAFIDQASQLDRRDVPSEPTHIKAAKLMAEMEQLRADLATTRIALERANDLSFTNFINRVGDLQENLVEIQYQVKTKHLLHSEMVISTTTAVYPASSVQQIAPMPMPLQQNIQQHPQMVQPPMAMQQVSPQPMQMQIPENTVYQQQFAPAMQQVPQAAPSQHMPFGVPQNGQVYQQQMPVQQQYATPSGFQQQPSTGLPMMPMSTHLPLQTAPVASPSGYQGGYQPAASQVVPQPTYVAQPPFAHQLQANAQPFANPPLAYTTPNHRRIDLDSEFEL